MGNFIPDRGDVVWLNLDPQAGHEQAGHRPVIVLSPAHYNRKVGLAIMCPITSQVKGFPFEVIIPPGFPIQGVILADQAKNLDWRARQAQFVCKLPGYVTIEVLQKLNVLLQV